MENRVKILRRLYEGFGRGEVDPLVVRDEAVSVLEELGENEGLEEIEDMLIDLEFSIEENRCKCHRICSGC